MAYRNETGAWVDFCTGKPIEGRVDAVEEFEFFVNDFPMR